MGAAHLSPLYMDWGERTDSIPFVVVYNNSRSVLELKWHQKAVMIQGKRVGHVGTVKEIYA